MKRRQVLLSDAWSEVEKNPEGATPKRSQRTINCNTTCSIGKIAQQETTCVPVAQVTDASVDLDSAATISDHDTTGLLECSAVYAVVMKWKRISLNRKRFFSKFLKMEGILHVRGIRKIFMDYVVPDKKFVLPISNFCKL